MLDSQQSYDHIDRLNDILQKNERTENLRKTNELGMNKPAAVYFEYSEDQGLTFCKIPI